MYSKYGVDFVKRESSGILRKVRTIILSREFTSMSLTFELSWSIITFSSYCTGNKKKTRAASIGEGPSLNKVKVLVNETLVLVAKICSSEEDLQSSNSDLFIEAMENNTVFNNVLKCYCLRVNDGFFLSFVFLFIIFCGRERLM